MRSERRANRFAVELVARRQHPCKNKILNQCMDYLFIIETKLLQFNVRIQKTFNISFRCQFNMMKQSNNLDFFQLIHGRPGGSGSGLGIRTSTGNLVQKTD